MGANEKGIWILLGILMDRLTMWSYIYIYIIYLDLR